MSIQAVLLPVLAQVVLVFFLLGLTAKARQDAFKAGLPPSDIALSGEGFPPRSRQYANCFANQFEIPVLFFFAVIFGIVLHQTGWLFVVCEWLFVALRLGHAFVHVTSNRVPLRGGLFIGSAFAAALLWLLIFAGVLLSGRI